MNPSSSAPPDGNGDSWSPIISPDGRFVLFASTADNLVPTTNSNGIPELNPPGINVYLRDRSNETTTLVSVNFAGTGGGNDNSFPTGLSTNGEFALFESAATNLVANDACGANEVFLRDMLNGVTRLVSVATNGASGNGAACDSTLTPDGQYVAFASAASNLTANDTNGIADVFVRDLQSGTTTLVSVGAQSADPASGSQAPEITPDGRYVTFYSTATNLVPNVTMTGEIYVRDLLAGTTTWASTNARAISDLGTNGFCYNQAISDDGQYIAYEISSNNPTATNAIVLRYNQQTGLTDVVFTNATMPAGANQDKRSLSMTPDGNSIVYVANSYINSTCVYLWSAQTFTNILVSCNLVNGLTAGANVYSPDVDRAGRYVVFVSTDTNLLMTTNASAGIFLRDMQEGATMLVSVDTNGLTLPVDPQAVPSLSANGGSVAFESPAADLDGRNLDCDVFARDLTNAASQLISMHDPNLASVTPNGPSLLSPGSVSSNGEFVAYASWANNLAANASNSCPEIFVCDLASGSNILVSVDTNGFPGAGNSIEPSISGDGYYVAFASTATNLVPGATNHASEIFVRDTQSGTTTLVSVSTNGDDGNGDCNSPIISADGRFVLFCSQALNLISGTDTNLLFRDLQLGETYGLANGSSLYDSMTPDGHYVAFVGMVNVNTGLYVWNSQTAAYIYTNTSGALTNVSISPDGHWLVYVAGSLLYAQDLIGGTNYLIANGPFGPHVGLNFSANSDFLAYAGSNDVYLYNFITGSNLLVSHNFYSASSANGASDSPIVSADGRFVAYRSAASDIVPGDSNGVPDLFLYDTMANSTILLSVNRWGNTTGNNRSLTPVFSGDGQTLFFQSWASDLVARDFNLASDLFALNLAPFENETNLPPGPSLDLIFSGMSAMGQPGQQTPVITWPYTAGPVYSVQFKDNLTNAAWQKLNGNLTIIGKQAYMSDFAPSAGQRFYRAMLRN